MLDGLGQRYGTRPSSFMGLAPWDGRSVVVDMFIARNAVEEEQIEGGTLQGSLKEKRSKWDRDTMREVREEMASKWR